MRFDGGFWMMTWTRQILDDGRPGYPGGGIDGTHRLPVDDEKRYAISLIIQMRMLNGRQVRSLSENPAACRIRDKQILQLWNKWLSRKHPSIRCCLTNWCLDYFAPRCLKEYTGGEICLATKLSHSECINLAGALFDWRWVTFMRGPWERHAAMAIFRGRLVPDPLRMPPLCQQIADYLPAPQAQAKIWCRLIGHLPRARMPRQPLGTAQ